MDILNISVDQDAIDLGQWVREQGPDNDMDFKVLGFASNANIAYEAKLDAETMVLATAAREAENFGGTAIDLNWDSLGDPERNALWLKTPEGAKWEADRVRQTNGLTAAFLLQDWKGVSLGGTQIEFSAKAAQRIMTDVRFYPLALLVKRAAMSLSNRTLKYESAAIKNLHADLGLEWEAPTPSDQNSSVSGSGKPSPAKSRKKPPART